MCPERYLAMRTLWNWQLGAEGRSAREIGIGPFGLKQAMHRRVGFAAEQPFKLAGRMSLNGP